MRKFSYTLCVLFLALAFWGCNSDWLNGKTQEITFDGSEYYLPVDSDATTVVLSGVKNQALTYVVMNTGKSSIYGRNISASVQDRSASETDESESYDYDVSFEKSTQREIVRVDYNPTYPEPNVEAFASSRSLSQPEVYESSVPTSSVAKTMSVGATRNFYALTDSEMSDWTKQIPCTLRAIGKDDSGNIICYVWVHDDVYSLLTNSSDEKINLIMARNLADTFAKYKKAETDLMGEESNEITYVTYDSTDGFKKTRIPMKNVSETGDVVNIVVYDIAGDFSSTKTSGTLGFVSPKDYWCFEDECFADGVAEKVFSDEDTLNYYKGSNKCKVFYCDSAWCNFNIEAYNKYTDSRKDSAKWWESKGDEPSGDMVSTMFHEFQHMIHYGNKSMNSGVSSSSWFNEMMSMLVEDVLQPIIDFDESSSPSKTRLPTFNEYYFELGADTWHDGDKMVYSYSSAYAFGAWLVRNYGGAKLLHELSTNSYADWDSIVAAVSSVTGLTVTRASLIRDWALASCFLPTYAKNNSLPTYYKTPDTYTVDEYDYYFKPINLYSEDYKWTDEDEKVSYYGIALMKSNRYTVYPGGFVHMPIGKSSSDAVTLTLPRWSGSGEKIYILVHGDSYNLKEADSLSE